MFHSTGSVRVVAIGRSGTETTTTPGSTSKPSIGRPFASTGTAGALCVRSVVTSPKRTVAKIAATRPTWLSGPVILTSVGEIDPGAACSPSGGEFAYFTCTATVREVMRSSRTDPVAGDTAPTFTPSFAVTTFTLASCG